MRGSEFAALKAFVEVAERRSFARAAEALRVAPSTLSQTIRELEERVGVTLLTRTTRRVSLTGAGARLLDRFAPALRDMDAALLDTRDEGARPRGVVRLHAPAPAYAGHIEPVLGLVRRTLPDLILDVTIDDGLADVAADGFDLVIRRSDYVDSGMVAHDLGGDLRHTVVASPAYIAEQGCPASPTDLGEHRCIRWRRPATSRLDRWRFAVNGAPVVIAVAGPLIVSHCPAAIEAARQGVGIAYVLESYAAESIRGRRAVAAPHRIPSDLRRLETVSPQPRAPLRRRARDRRCVDAITVTAGRPAVFACVNPAPRPGKHPFAALPRCEAPSSPAPRHGCAVRRVPRR